MIRKVKKTLAVYTKIRGKRDQVRFMRSRSGEEDEENKLMRSEPA